MPNMIHQSTLSGPWKIHATLLVLLITQMVLITVFSMNSNVPRVNTRINSGGSEANIIWKDMTTGSMNHRCHSILLLIAGVDSNPGPSTNDDTVPSAEDILADLTIGAPNDEIRDCLRLYNHNHTLKKQKMEIGKCKRDTIVATLDYLDQPGQAVYNKTECINNLICRIQSYLPDECNICKTMYYVRLGEVPLLTCEICGQGSHNRCILDKLMIPDDMKDSFEPDQALSKLNPTLLPGLHYLCGACEETTIPQKENGLLRRYTIAQGQPATSQQENEETNPDEEPSTGEDVTTDQGRSPSPSSDNRASPPNQDTTISTPPQRSHSDPLKICRFYRKGTCRYGLSGKGCPHEHPKPCKKLLMHGNKGPRGCTLGRANCDKFHPRMCPSSLTSGECLTTNCSLRHVAGTKMPLKEQTYKSDRYPMNSKRDQSKKQSTQSESMKSTQKNSQNPDSVDFLDAIRLLKTEMMEAMDLKLAQLLSTQKPAPNTSIPQSPMGMPQMMYPAPMFIPQMMMSNRMAQMQPMAHPNH